MAQLAALCITLLIVSGCGVPFFVKPEEQAVVDEHIFSDVILYKPLTWMLASSGVRTASTKVERRIIVFERTKAKNGQMKLKICAEPPAEALQALESINKLTAELQAKKIPLTATGTGDFSLQTAVQSAFRRTQGLQFYRDGAYQWCQAYINGLIDEPEFRQRLKQLEESAEKLIMKEIQNPGFYGKYQSSVAIRQEEENGTDP